MNSRDFITREQRGALLIEVLIAMLLLSLGLLAMAGLQRASMQAFGNSRRNLEASLIAHDLVERIRAYPVEASAGVFDDDQREDRLLGNDAVHVHLERGADLKHPWVIRLAWEEPATFADDPHASSGCAAAHKFATAANFVSTTESCMSLEFMP